LTKDGLSSQGQWSPDGREIVFTRDNGDCTSAEESDIFVMGADGSHVRRLTRDRNDFNASFSPDGKRLVFQDGPSLVVSDTDAKHRRVIAKKGEYPVWSPDGKRLLYFLEGNGSGDTAGWVVNADGSHRIRFPDAGGAAWTPNGAAIAYSRGRGRCRESSCQSKELWLVRADGSGETQLTSEPAHTGIWDNDPAWSPDGREIAFAHVRNQGSDLVVLTVSDRSQRILVRNGYYPVWSPDGSLIAFELSPGKRSSIWVIHPDGSQLRRVTSSRLPDHAPVWQP
jgi:Tol biopolymer transport system component